MALRTALLRAAVSAVALTASAALANDIAYVETIQRTDMTAAALGGVRGYGYGTMSLSGVGGHPVTKAYLFWHGPESGGGDNHNITLNGNWISGVSIGNSSDNCWGFDRSQAYRADVTSLVPGDGNYSLDNMKKGSIDINGATLMVFYDDGNPAGYRDVVLFDGNDSNINNPFDAPGWNIFLPGIDYKGGNAQMRLSVSDGQPFPDDAVVVNGSVLVGAGEIFDGNFAQIGPNKNPFQPLWDYRSFDVTGYLSPGNNNIHMTTGVNSDCLSLVTATIDLPAGSSPGPQINPPPPTPGQGGGVVGPAGGDQSITITLTNQDGSPIAGQGVGFNITQGPNAGQSGSDTTNGSGNATFNYQAGDGTGTDVIEVTSGTAVTHVVNQIKAPPVANCQGTTVSLDQSLQAAIGPAQLDAGSSSPYGAALTSATNRTSLGCGDLGLAQVTLTVTDTSTTLSASCTSTVTVLPNTPQVSFRGQGTTAAGSTGGGDYTYVGESGYGGTLTVDSHTCPSVNLNQYTEIAGVTANAGSLAADENGVVHGNIGPIPYGDVKTYFNNNYALFVGSNSDEQHLLVTPPPPVTQSTPNAIANTTTFGGIGVFPNGATDGTGYGVTVTAFDNGAAVGTTAMTADGHWQITLPFADCVNDTTFASCYHSVSFSQTAGYDPLQGAQNAPYNYLYWITPPRITINSPPAGQTLPGVFQAITLTYRPVPPGVFVPQLSMFLDGQTLYSGAPAQQPSRLDFSWLYPGQHTYGVQAQDNVVNADAGPFNSTFTYGPNIATLTALTCDAPTGPLGGLANLNAGNLNSLCVKLRNSAAAEARGNSNAAGNILGAYINELDAMLQSGRLDAKTHDVLVADARWAIAHL